jgi:hypothetical protein
VHAYGKLSSLTIFLFIAIEVRFNMRYYYEIHNIIILLTRI